MLEIVSFTLGPAQTNAYLVAHSDTKEAVVIDPSWDGHVILDAAKKRGWRIGHMWYTHAHFDRQTLWPVHPLDKITDEPTKPFRMLYFGAAGVIWALDHLRVVGATAMQRIFKDALIDLAAKNRAEMQLRAPHTYSYLMGDVGIQLVQWRISPSDTLADQIFQDVEANMTNPAREIIWGAPGTMLAALFMLESTGEPRWKEVYLRSVLQLLNEWERNAEHNCHVWTQDLYGRSSIYLGAVHGFAANVFSIIKGRSSSLGLGRPSHVARKPMISTPTGPRRRVVRANSCNIVTARPV